MKKTGSPIEYIKSSLDIFFQKDNFLFFLKVYAVLLPFAVLTFVQKNYIKGIENNIKSGSFPAISLAFVIIGLLYLVVSFWVSAAGLFAVSKTVFNIKTSVREVYSESWKRLWKFSILLILQGLIIGLGFLILVVPGIIAMVWFSFATFEFVVKGTGIRTSLAGSRNLVKARFWPVLGRIAIFGLFALIFQIIVSLIPYGIGSIISPFFGALLTLPYFLLYKDLSA